MATEIFDDKEAFLRALQGKPRANAKRAREARPGLPRAGRVVPTGLTSLIAPKRESGLPAWSYAFDVVKGHRLYVQGVGALDTGWQASEKAACDAAKELSK